MWRRWIVIALVLQGLGLMLLLVAATGDDSEGRAIALMGLSLILVWVVGFGLLTVYRGNGLVRILGILPGRWSIQFVLGCTILALLEEAVTTSLTNMAGLFGDETGEAQITASSNYLEVVALHSVIVFIPMFVGWAWMLHRWSFSPFAGFLLFGLTGMLAEIMSSGPQQVLGFGMWIPVYGLMIYLPIRAFAPRNSRRPPFWAYPAAIVIPIVVAVPVVIAVLGVRSLI